MIDIHSHFLHSVDDGPEEISTTKEILSKYQELGFTAVVETTHCYPGLFETPYQIIQGKISEIKDDSINIYATREYFVDFNFLEKLKNNIITPYPDGKHILIEFSFSIPPINWEYLIFEIETKGFIPVLAHPERYDWINSMPDFIKDFKQRNGKLQGNLGSFIGYYGRSARRNFKKLFNAKMYDFLATDTHSPMHLEEIIKNWHNIIKELEEKNIKILLEENPASLVEVKS